MSTQNTPTETTHLITEDVVNQAPTVVVSTRGLEKNGNTHPHTILEQVQHLETDGAHGKIVSYISTKQHVCKPFCSFQP